jgi:hypothetical protein
MIGFFVGFISGICIGAIITVTLYIIREDGNDEHW